MQKIHYFDQKLMALGLRSSSAEEVIESLGELLYQQGYVKDTFITSAIERERKFATGLPLGEINVALPHTDIDHVIRPAIAVGVLDSPVDFCTMGNPDKTIPVSVVFLLAIKDAQHQVGMLKCFAEFLQVPELVKEMTTAKSTKKIEQILSQHLIL